MLSPNYQGAHNRPDDFRRKSPPAPLHQGLVTLKLYPQYAWLLVDVYGPRLAFRSLAAPDFEVGERRDSVEALTRCPTVRYPPAAPRTVTRMPGSLLHRAVARFVLPRPTALQDDSMDGLLPEVATRR
jgi:hypothetical protein